MKRIEHFLCFTATVVALLLCGCASNNEAYDDDEEYSSMPWNTPQNWEAGPAIPGLSNPGY